MKRSGSADLPLHNGRVPRWLSGRMARLGRVISEAIVLHYGHREFLSRLSHPFWFQSFGAVMGMDWHSSGITTSVLGALKKGLGPISDELGLYVCGGRGRHSRATPHELLDVGFRTGLDAESWVRTSRLVAKVDSAAVQDGFELYQHCFVASRDGDWAVVQQGMNGASRQARRYHWLSHDVPNFVDSPHSAIDGQPQGNIVNLADRRAARTRDAQLELVREGPERATEELRRLGDRNLALPLPSPGALQPHLAMPAHHEVRSSDLILKRLHASLSAARDTPLDTFEDLLLVPGVGQRTLFSLAMVAEVLHGTPARFSDPARYSMAHGGKDGHPFPVPLKVYDETIGVLKRAVERAKLGQDDKLCALRALDARARALEGGASGPEFASWVRAEKRRSPGYGGRSVFQDGARETPSSQGPPQRPGKPPLARSGHGRSPAWRRQLTLKF